MKTSLTALYDNPNIWRASQRTSCEQKYALGHQPLDHALNGGIAPSGVVRISSHTGIGELSLFKAVLTEPQKHKLRVFINCPAIIQAPWLNAFGIDLKQTLAINTQSDDDALWAAEQCLKSTACHCVVLWNNKLTAKTARRLQVASTHNDALCLIFCDNPRDTSLPISLDLSLHRHEKNVTVDVLKQRHGWPVKGISISLPWTPDNTAIQSAMCKSTSQKQAFNSVI